MATTHHYQARCTWTGSTGAGYEAYDRRHRAEAPPAVAALELASDPAFRGDPSLLNPEQLLVLAASSCQLLSFLAVASRARLDVVAYEDDAMAEMTESHGPASLSRIVLRPRITLAGPVDEARLRHLVEVAHRQCYIANSLKTSVEVDATFVEAFSNPGSGTGLDEFGGQPAS
ncbi:MAG: OsmC family protein [Acidimicrobiales bacterium]